MFRVYKIAVVFDEKLFSEVWIDPHFEEKHGESISDELILSLLQWLNGRPVVVQMESKGFQFFELDIEWLGKSYRLILVVPPDCSYLGVRNMYRKKKI